LPNTRVQLSTGKCTPIDSSTRDSPPRGAGIAWQESRAAHTANPYFTRATRCSRLSTPRGSSYQWGYTCQ